MLKPTKLNIEKQVRPGNDGDLLAVEGAAPEWQTPAEAGISTEAFAQERATETLASANQYSDARKAESLAYTDAQTVQTKFELQNYADDEVATLNDDVTERLSQKADLVNNRVPSSQLPGFAQTFELYPTQADFPPLGDPVVLYVAEDTNRSYRWTGSGYLELVGFLDLGETSETAYRGDRGRMAYDHTTVTSNPHQVNKAQVGLSDADNTSDADKPVSIAQQAALDLKANTVHTHAITDVTGLQAQLDSKAGSGTLAPVATSGSYQDLTETPTSAAYTAITASSLVPNVDDYIQYNYTALAEPLSIENPIGSAVDGSKLIFRIRSEGANRALSWGTDYRPIALNLPTESAMEKIMYVGALYNYADSKWDVVALVEEE